MAIFENIKNFFVKEQTKNTGIALVSKSGNGSFWSTEGEETGRVANWAWYRQAYENVPLINAIINVQTDQVVQEFYFEGSNSEKLEKWADDVNLMQFFHKVTKNLLIYGNGFAELISEGNIISKLKLINPEWMVLLFFVMMIVFYSLASRKYGLRNYTLLFRPVREEPVHNIP